MNRPQPNDYHEMVSGYISLVEGNNVLEVLKQQSTDFPDFLNNLIDKADYAYAPGKWTIKEMAGHIIDTERILTYRLLCIARGEQSPLPGFEENDYVKQAHFADSSLLSLSEEFSLVRRANLYLYNSLNAQELERKGTAAGRQLTVNALLFTIAGHLIHHTQIIKERYL
ncbi:DinB family protein [Pedobacter sp.]|jgi:hypothetical protein|uniref:DinB family protein n=1 Tax=Pedobacter sp. TaxID=1411316 RepID=UPI002C04FF9F|nr:DinB family protein [Pedobacter sp.]HWW43359.1 DinB family protein [Pedobacter sp.]